jgi:VanZ family protein
MSKNILKHIIRYILIIFIIIVCATIFKFSSEKSETSSKTSGKFAGIIVDLFENGQKMSTTQRDNRIEQIQHYVRKAAHFSIYLLLGFLMMCCMQTFNCVQEYKFDISTMFVFLYACTDELHQLFVSRKKCRICRCMPRYSRS